MRRAVMAVVGVLALAAMLPGVAIAANPPSVFTSDVHSTASTTATVDGGVNPQGQTTTFKAEWDLASSTWCMTGGVSGTPANTTTGQSLGFTDSNFHAVSVNLTGLTAGTAYCADLSATNGTGTSGGGQVTFIAGTPVAQTTDVTVTGASTATVAGSVNPAGQSTTYKVEFDLASSTWCTSGGSSGTPASTTTPQTLGFTDATAHDVTVDITGLTGGSAYCADLVATNTSGVGDGGQVGFTAGLPSAATNGVTTTGATTATVSGEVSPAGQSTTYKVSFDTASSAWCTSGGSSGTPANTTTTQTLGFTDTSFHSVTVDISGLTAGTSYCAALIATNGSGSGSGGQVTFTAGTPDAQISDVNSTGASTATVDGSANPSGQSTTYKVSYDLASSTWCMSGGTSGSPANSTTPQTLGFTDSSLHAVSVNLTGLTGGTAYCVELVVTNGSGSASAGPIQFTAGVPQAITFGATSTGATTVTIDGEVNPDGQTTTYKVSYDLASSTWCTSGGSSGTPANTTTPQTLGFTNTIFDSVSVDLGGLTAGSAYCAELIATNGSGTGSGGQAPFTAGLPNASTFGATATGLTTERVDGIVNPAGQSATYKAEFDVASSNWCSSNGSSGSPASTTTPQTLGFTDSTFHSVSVDLTGLTAGTSYCARLVATNGSGFVSAEIVTFTAGAPVASTFGATATGATTASVSGQVNPISQATTYKVQYDVASSVWCSSGGSSGSPANTTTSQPLAFTDTSFHDVSVGLTGLTAGTSYCVDLIATNAAGTGDGGQVQFTAGAPVVSTNDVAGTGATTADVHGAVNPSGQSTNYKVEYDLASSTWCTTGGGSGTPANTTTPQSLGFTDSTSHSVTVSLSGLTSGTAYCADLVATNAAGTGDGGQVGFTAGLAPGATTGIATSVTTSGATLNGSVNPNGLATSYHFDYGTTASYGSSTVSASAGAGSSAVPEITTLSGLAPNTTYHFRIVATSTAGTTNGTDQTFTTSTVTSSQPPAATTGAATAVTASAATLNGTVNPNGVATTYHFDYGTTASYGSSTASASAGSGSSAVPETAGISGLAPNTTYHFRIVATSTAGTTNGADQTFTTGAAAGTPLPPAATTGSASAVTVSGATLNGTVNPKGVATSYHFEYGTTASYGSSTASASAGSGSAALPETGAISGLAANTTYHFRIVATSSAGTANGADLTFTTAKLVPPVLSGVRLKASKFLAKRGTKLTFTLSVRARVSLVITTSVPGRKVGGRCKANAKTGKACKLTVRKGSQTLAGAAGANSFTFKPKLGPGRYKLTLVATDPFGLKSKTITITFTIAKPPKK